MKYLWLVVGVFGVWLWWGGEDPASAPVPDDIHAAVLRDGFALHAEGQPHRVREISRKGPQRTEHVIDRDGDIRVVGTRAGAAAGWLDSKKVRLVSLKNKRELGVFGKSARMLCDGVASNDERFAIGWLEADGVIWFVHGPTGETQAIETNEVDEPVLAARADPKNWCGIASAEGNIALFWRERDRMYINTCTKKQCSGLPAAVAFPRDDVLLGVGCLRKACLLAVREKSGTSRLTYVTESGSAKWTKPLATNELSVSIVGVGDRSFAVGYVGSEGAEVLRIDAKGAAARVWQGAASGGVPALAWSRDQLLVGPRIGPASVIPLPR
jgi:hypothetical protein